MKTFICALSVSLLIITVPSEAQRKSRKSLKTSFKGATKRKAKSRKIASVGRRGNLSGRMRAMNKPIEVKGQSRTLSMMLILKNKKDRINFVKVKNDFREEILGTNY